jgi:hypothetical protein
MIKQLSLFSEESLEEDQAPKKPTKQLIWWRFTRGVRRVDHRILVALSCFKKVCEGKTWNTKIALELEREYKDNGVIKDCQEIPGKNGTARTITAWLKAFGFCYKGPDKAYLLTHAAEDILRDNNLMEIVFFQLLNFQYPSQYSIKNKIMPDGEIKPLLFVVRLLLDLGRLTSLELCIAVCLAKKWSDYNKCVALIKEYRQTTDLPNIIEIHGPKEYACMVKSYNKKVVKNRACDPKAFLKPLLEEVQTIKSSLTSIGLLKEIDKFLELAEDISEDRMKFIRACIEDSEKNPVDTEEDLTLLQRRYGSWQGKKINRATPRISSYRKTTKEFILENFYRHSKESLKPPHKIAEAIHSELGLDQTYIENVISPHITEGETIFEQNFIESSTEKQRATEFERNTCELFNKRFGYQAYHTGQMNREVKEEGKFSDVLLVIDSESCIIIDNKATQGSYCMPQKDRDAMLLRYSKSLPELIRKHGLNKDIQLKGICFISSSFSPAIDEKLQYLNDKIGVPISAIRACDLINLSRKGISKENFLRIMCQTKIISLSDF